MQILNRNYLIRCLLLVILITLSSCSNKAYYHAEATPDFIYQSSEKLFIFLPKDPSPEDQTLLSYLKQAVRKKGYNQVSTHPFEYAMFFKFYDNFNISTFTAPISTSTSLFSSGNTSKLYYPESTKNDRSYDIPVTNSGKSINIQVQLYSATKNFKGKYDLLWSGHIGVNEDQYQKNPQAIIDVLISLLGEEFKGDLPVN